MQTKAGGRERRHERTSLYCGSHAALRKPSSMPTQTLAWNPTLANKGQARSQLANPAQPLKSWCRYRSPDPSIHQTRERQVHVCRYCRRAGWGEITPSRLRKRMALRHKDTWKEKVTAPGNARVQKQRSLARRHAHDHRPGALCPPVLRAQTSAASKQTHLRKPHPELAAVYLLGPAKKNIFLCRTALCQWAARPLKP